MSSVLDIEVANHAYVLHFQITFGYLVGSCTILYMGWDHADWSFSFTMHFLTTCDKKV